MKRKYPSDLSGEEWKGLKERLPKERILGRPREVKIRQIWNGIFYILRTGCAWRYLPKEYPKWQLVYYYFRKWTEDGTIEKIHDILRREVRKKAGRKETPSMGLIDSQSVKTTEKGGEKGYDAGKKN